MSNGTDQPDKQPDKQPGTQPGYEAFAARARAGTIVPVWRDVLLDLETPVTAFWRLRQAGSPAESPFAFLLESAPAGSEAWARYTFLGADACGAWRLRGGVVEDWKPGDGWSGARRPSDPIADLRAKLTAPAVDADAEAGPFWGGAVGYFGYDVVRHIERLPNAPASGADISDALFMFTRTVVMLDNLRGRARITCSVPITDDVSPGALRAAWSAAQRDIDEAEGRLGGPGAPPPMRLDPVGEPATGTSSLSREAFEAGVRRIKDYILAGDCFQALLARRIRMPHDFSATALYRAIRVLNPSPYMFHLALDGVEVVGSSPELQVRVMDGEAVVRPIAGTCPRGATAAEDTALGERLLADEKERAEHVMLVDLGRNDIGRVAEYGSVKVSQFMQVERFSHVQHLVSEVRGRVGRDRSALDVFRATFPAGTMTGAPKVRAMEIIDELESERRGPYSGALGYIAYGDRRADLAITIRTCVMANGEASVAAGAGIVADSDPGREWAETEVKARAMLTAVAHARAAEDRDAAAAGAKRRTSGPRYPAPAP